MTRDYSYTAAAPPTAQFVIYTRMDNDWWLTEDEEEATGTFWETIDDHGRYLLIHLTGDLARDYVIYEVDGDDDTTQPTTFYCYDFSRRSGR